MSKHLTVPQPDSTDGGIYSIGYNAWTGNDGLPRMFDALESEGVTILVDTRNSDFRAKYSFDQLAAAAREHQGIDEQPMRFAHRPALTGKPKADHEYNGAGQADYTAMDKREEVGPTLDSMAAAARKGERIALLCGCKDVHTCHRARWLAESLDKRGVDVGHIEPGEYNYERDTEAGERELYSITPHSQLPELPDHSDRNWAQQAAYWRERNKPKPPPTDYQSPQATRPIPSDPTQVLIAGSMNANNAQLNYASALVVRAAEVGARIHVGDNDQGVDARVVETANSIGYENVVVWTAGDDPRNGGVAGGQVRKVPHNPREPGGRFSQRDRTMIRSLDDEHGAAFFIDNGFTHRRNGSLTGTEAGYTVAVEQGKAARKMSFGEGRDREAELKPLPTSYTPKSPPDMAAEPMVGYAIHAVQTVDAEGQHLGHSAVALRDVYEDGVPMESSISASYAMELARFEQADNAEQYAAALTQYIKDKDGLEFVGSPENTASTQTFLGRVVEENGLEVAEQGIDREAVFQQHGFQTDRNLSVDPMQLSVEEPSFDKVIEL
jgi:hypothetical protein